MSTTQPIRNKNEVRELTEYYLNKGKLRNHLLIVMGIQLKRFLKFILTNGAIYVTIRLSGDDLSSLGLVERPGSYRQAGSYPAIFLL